VRRVTTAAAAVLAAGMAAMLACGSSAPAKEPVPPASAAEIVAYHDSGEWRRDTADAAARARRFLLDHLDGVRQPAIVLDVDDTSLSSYDCLHVAGFDRSALTACATAATMPAIAPVRSLYRAARRRHVTVFFVTGRRAAMRVATVRNLHGRGFAGRIRLVLRGNGPRRGSNAVYKARERRRIEGRGYRILLNVGDQRTDLTGGHAARGIKLPNPMYVTR
jgi:predicted secreted acid phosphatase